MVGASGSLSNEILFKAAQDAVKTLQQLDDRNKLRPLCSLQASDCRSCTGLKTKCFPAGCKGKVGCMVRVAKHEQHRRDAWLLQPGR